MKSLLKDTLDMVRFLIFVAIMLAPVFVFFFV